MASCGSGPSAGASTGPWPSWCWRGPSGRTPSVARHGGPWPSIAWRSMPIRPCGWSWFAVSRPRSRPAPTSPSSPRSLPMRPPRMPTTNWSSWRWIRLEQLGKPTIAQIGGSCIGGGCGLAVACDLRFAASDARFGITPAKLGLAYSLGDVRRLVNLIGPARAKDLLFSARLIDAQDALRLGLVDRVVPTRRARRGRSRLCARPADPVGQLAAADQADHRAGAWRCCRREHRQSCLARQCGRPSGFCRRATGFPGKAPTTLRVSEHGQKVSVIWTVSV